MHVEVCALHLAGIGDDQSTLDYARGSVCLVSCVVGSD